MQDMLEKKIKLEICAPSVQSAIHADIAGADRIELCQNLLEGGTTPSYGAIRYCAQHLSLQTNVLIRPRTGDFCYNDAEFETIKNDVKVCKELGVHAVVVGFLHADLTIDIEKTKEIVQLAAPMEVTFHRAFDICADWRVALEQIIESGCTRILTSGTYPTAYEGISVLKEIVAQAGDRIIILAGSGVNYTNAEEIVVNSGVTEIHSSCTMPISTYNAHFSKEKYIDQANYTHKESDLELIKKILSLQIHINP
jgi:copper homeostasis protein